MHKCALCKALKKEKDKFVYEDEYVVYLPTKNMKGHHKRLMVSIKDHISYDEINPILEEKIITNFITFCKGYFDEEPTFALCESTYCTIPKHWHLVACDWFGYPEEVQQLHYTPHESISTFKKWEPKK